MLRRKPEGGRVGEPVAGSRQREFGIERTRRRHHLVLASVGVLLLIGGSSPFSPSTSAQTPGMDPQLANLELRLQLAEQHIADLTTELKKSSATASRVKAPFEVVGPYGAVVMKIGADAAGGQLEVKDGLGRTVVYIGASGQTGEVTVRDGRGGQGRASLFVGQKGGSGVIDLADVTGQPILRAGAQGEGGLPKVEVLYNAQVRARMEARADLGVITAFSGDGKPAASVGGKFSGEGPAGVRVYNGGGQPIVGMSADPKNPSAGFLGVADATGKVRISLLTSSEGDAAVNVGGGASNAVSLGVVENRGQLVIFNPAGSPVVHATTNPAGQGEVLIKSAGGVNAFMRDEGADGASCVVRKGKIHCLGIGLPLGPN
jgi:hypothetical protein